MAGEKRADFSAGPMEKSRTLGADSNQDIRQAESSLTSAENLIEKALYNRDELGDMAARLTLAQWNLGRNDRLSRQWPRQAAILIAVMATALYLTYRLFWTMNLASVPAAAFSSLLLAAEFYAGLSLGLYFFQVWRLVEPPLRRPTTWSHRRCICRHRTMKTSRCFAER